MTREIVDSYSHCGQNKYRPIEDIRRVMAKYGVSRTVLIQHMGEYDNTYIEQIVSAEPERFAGVFLINTDSAEAAETLAFWAGKKLFRGIRLLARTVETHPKLWQQAADAGLNIVLFEEPTSAPYVDALRDFLMSYPNAKLVLAHFGRLDPAELPHFRSFDRILTLADCPNAFLQISGMDAFAPYPFEQIVPLVQRSLEAFGPDRMLYGSNYPAGRSEEAYGQDLELLLSGKLGVPAGCLDSIVRSVPLTLWFDK